MCQRYGDMRYRCGQQSGVIGPATDVSGWPCIYSLIIRVDPCIEYSEYRWQKNDKKGDIVYEKCLLLRYAATACCNRCVHRVITLHVHLNAITQSKNEHLKSKQVFCFKRHLIFKSTCCPCLRRRRRYWPLYPGVEH